jgi:hypothetical protein
MSDTNDGDMSFDDAVQLVMQRTGKNRRQATAALKEKCRQGEIPATGVNVRTGRREPIPPEAFSEH